MDLISNICILILVALLSFTLIALISEYHKLSFEKSFSYWIYVVLYLLLLGAIIPKLYICLF